MGEDFCVCCVCGEATSDYQRYNSCDGCGKSYCCKECTKVAIEYIDDGEKFIYCLDCFNIDGILDDIKEGKIKLQKALEIYQNAIDMLKKRRRELKSKIEDYNETVKVLKQ